MAGRLLFLLSGLFFNCGLCDMGSIIKDINVRKDLQNIIITVLNDLAKRNDVTCVTAITDDIYLNIFDGGFFKRTRPLPFVTIVVQENEDLLSPNFDTLESISRAKDDGCNMYVILLANGLQVTRLLKFGERYRLLNTRAKFIMLYDIRLFHSDFHYLWKRIVNAIFIKHHKKIIGKLKSKPWFDISTVPYPNPIKGVFVPRRVDIWRNGRFQYGKELFFVKTSNLNGEILNVVYLEHVPSVMIMKQNVSDKVSGVEVEILNTLSQKMNFKPKLYQPINSDVHKWGEMQANGSYSGLLGEMVTGKADVALGNLQYTPYHLDLSDLSIPYTSQCWTFLTPEALTDNSWKTLILPFKLNMWIAVLLVLLVTGTIFFGLAHYYLNLITFREDLKDSCQVNKEKSQGEKPVGLYLFGEITNSILYTYGMLLVVSLPKLPTGWSIRLLTGWYWLYCILLVVSYRASMTAILANPAPRVTIDNLNELVDSKLKCGGWGSETKKFFQQSLDEKGQKVGDNFELINDPNEAATRIARGVFAYYDSSDFLKYLSVRRKQANTMIDVANFTMNSTEVDSQGERNLHIMSDCVVNAPISIGFHKNSPLKPLVDIYLKQIIEVGLIEKWQNDAMYKIRTLDTSEEEIKALINLKKMYCAFIALAIGYTISTLCLLGEYAHWNLVVKRDPTFDKYNLDEYFKSKNKKTLIIYLCILLFIINQSLKL